jgi:phosphatidylglycerol lysyltransferase
VALTFDPFPLPHRIQLPVPLRAIGVLLLALLAAYALFAVLRRQPIRVHDLEIEPPSGRLFAAQVLISALDWMFAGTALYVLFPRTMPLSWFQFLGVYLLAGVIALLSHVPGGLGVLESVLVMFLARHGGMHAHAALGAVLLYRGIYYILPLLIASVVFAVNEAVRYRAAIVTVSRTAAAGLSAVAPPLLAMTSFLAGVILLVSGVTPPSPTRISALARVIPLAVIETAHFLGSVVGAALVIIARSLVRRLDGAVRVATVLLIAGAGLSILKGGDWEEAVALLIVLGALLASRREFYRKSALLNEPTTAAWAMAAVVAVAGSIWLGLFAYEHVEYSSELWWRFAVDQHAPRFLRASVGMVTVVVLAAVYRLVRPIEIEPEGPTPDEMEFVRAIVARTNRTSANLALLGDKAFLLNEAKNAFIMYGVEGRSWIAMGDPVGPEDEWPELVWRFQRACDRYAARCVFYEVSARHLDLYADVGLALLKIGEDARVDLASFSLEGGARKDLRHTVNHIEKAGGSFRIVDAGEVGPLLPELRRISNEWLAHKNAREKSFSLGSFDESYVARFPCALAESHGKIVAFANLWLGGERAEASIDLMRYAADAPSGVMEYLFVHLMLWAKQQGLRDVQSRHGAPRRARAARERVHVAPHRHVHLQARRALLQLRRPAPLQGQVRPDWEPVFLACPGVWSLPQIMADLSTLVSGGVQGVFRK